MFFLFWPTSSSSSSSFSFSILSIPSPLQVCRMKLGTGERTESPRLCIRLNAKDADRELWVRGCLGVKPPDDTTNNNNNSNGNNNNNNGINNSNDGETSPLPPTPFGPRKFDVRCGIQISLPKLSDMQRGGWVYDFIRQYLFTVLPAVLI